LNGLDIAIVTGLALAVLLGAVRGLMRLLLLTGFLILGWWLALRYQIPVARRLLGIDDGPGVLVGFVAIFLLVLVAGGLAGRLVVRLLKAADLRWMDRLAGAGAGFVVALVLAAAALLPLASALDASSPLMNSSSLAPPLLRLTGWLLPLVPAEVREAYERRQNEAQGFIREAAGETLK